jgi:hypothetical protein
MPPEEAGYTYAVEPTATDRLLANEEEMVWAPPPFGETVGAFIDAGISVTVVG